MTLSTRDPLQDGLIYQTPRKGKKKKKKSHWGDGLLSGLSSRPINHSLIRAHCEWGYTLRPHISTTDSQLSVVLFLYSTFQAPSLLLCPPSSLVLCSPQYKAACHLPERNTVWENWIFGMLERRRLSCLNIWTSPSPGTAFGCGITKRQGGKSVDWFQSICRCKTEQSHRSWGTFSVSFFFFKMRHCFCVCQIVIQRNGHGSRHKLNVLHEGVPQLKGKTKKLRSNNENQSEWWQSLKRYFKIFFYFFFMHSSRSPRLVPLWRSALFAESSLLLKMEHTVWPSYSQGQSG